jgi:hypothetical protein
MVFQLQTMQETAGVRAKAWCHFIHAVASLTVPVSKLTCKFTLRPCTVNLIGDEAAYTVHRAKLGEAGSDTGVFRGCSGGVQQVYRECMGVVSGVSMG